MSCIDVSRLPHKPLCGGKSKDGDISYQLLLGTSSAESDASFSILSQDNPSIHHPQEVTLDFYTEDGTRQRLVVEENLRVLDLCQLLSLKFNVARSHTWTVVERVPSLAIERSLEDHEDILQVYASWAHSYSEKDEENKFVFKQDFCKYEFFRTPQQFFPMSMLDLDSVPVDCLSESPEIAKFVTLQKFIAEGERAPVVQSHLWYKEQGQDSWKRLFFRIEESTLFFSSSSYALKDSKASLWPYRNLKAHNVYVPSENRCDAAPTSHSFCLKPCSSAQEYSKNIVWFSCESEKHRQCWLVAIRLAKHGKSIRENYKEVQSRYSDTTNADSTDGVIPDYTRMKPRVAMDFTGSRSRIVDDPEEAKAIAAAEGHTWKRRLPCFRQTVSTPQNASRPPLELGVHAVQPWFYSGMSRDEATRLLTKYGTVDGVFLVRESRRNPGSFVLSYVYNHKVHHCQIFPVEEKDQLCYSLDDGRTKFYDLLQLVEFYQLNVGSLPTKLTHFLVHRPRTYDGRTE